MARDFGMLRSELRARISEPEWAELLGFYRAEREMQKQAERRAELESRGKRRG